MDSQLSNIDELLSGMLDGVLSDAEVRQLESAMARDLSIQRRLDELSAMKYSLLSGRRTGKLSPDLAQIVTARAKAEAAKMGENAPRWLADDKLPAPTVPHTEAPGIPRSTWRPYLYAAAFTISAVFAVAFFSFPKDDKLGFVSQLPNPPGVENSPTETGNDLLHSPTSIPSAANPADRVGSPVLASNPEPSSVERETSPTGVASKAAMDKPSLAQSDAKIPSENDVLAGPKTTSPPKTGKLQVAVLDFTVDAIALDNSALEGILERHDIVYAKDLNITDEQLKALEDSRMINAGSSDDKIGVMFLKAKAKNLNLAMLDIIKQYKDFPECSMDMVVADKPLQKLVRQLAAISIDEDKEGIAKSLTLSGIEGRPPFASSARRGMIIFSKESRERELSPFLLNAANDISYALLLIRPAKAN